MKTHFKNFGFKLLTLVFFLFVFTPIKAQDGPPQFIRDMVRSTEVMLDSQGDASLKAYIAQWMQDTDDPESLLSKLRQVRDKMSGVRDDIMVEADPQGLVLIMSSEEEEKRLKIVIDREIKKVLDLLVLKQEAPLILTAENLPEVFNQLEKDGLSGIVHIKIDGKLVHEQAFGMANKEMGVSNTINTIFGTGSRPIDYTVAAIYLLDQEDKLSLNDPISRFFDNVPNDKKSITIRHLLKGESGFPDFFETEDDWDPDLAWIDRDTAMQRMLGQQLLFAPGTDNQHSHGAFVMLAAIVEIVAKTPYYQFIKEKFLIPAGMTHTGEYGESSGHQVSDFAAGYGYKSVGLPNIPPNWGPTSWLVKGSGGMYSTLGDLKKFYTLVRSEKVLDSKHNVAFKGATFNLDGSERGFELFSAFIPPGDEVYLFLNTHEHLDKMRQLFRALERFLSAKE